MIIRKKGTSVLEDKEYIKAENNAYNELVKYGYYPQGTTKDFKKVIVFKIKNKDTNNEEKEIYYFNNYQEAAIKLCDYKCNVRS